MEAGDGDMGERLTAVYPDRQEFGGTRRAKRGSDLQIGGIDSYEGKLANTRKSPD